MKRNQFLKTSLVGLLGIGSFAKQALASNNLALNKIEPIDYEIVKEFVLKAHRDFDRVKELLEQYPHVLNASVDWGDGDFETAIGAMGHMGYRDEALWMIDKGARADIFVLTMLGETKLVKAHLEAFPKLINSIGPHGFTLLHHAKKGKEHGQDLVDFLTEKGLTESHVKYFKKEE